MSTFVDTSVVVKNTLGQPIIGANVRIRRTEPNNEACGATNSPDGFLSFWCKADEPGLPPARLHIECPGFPTIDQPISITPTMGMIHVELGGSGLPQPTPNPVPPPGPPPQPPSPAPITIGDLHLEIRNNDFVDKYGRPTCLSGIDRFNVPRMWLD